LLFVIFLAAVMFLATSVILPSLLTQGRREKEDELIWRGQQYARAVRLYYHKYGRFPQSLEDLTKPKNHIHFLRKPYTDPMNRQDGSWRLIYIGPSGELIGTVRRRTLLQLPGFQQPPGATAGTSEPRAGLPAHGVASGTPLPTEAGAQQPTPPALPQQPPSTPVPMEGEGKIFGGNIIGVGSKVARPSLKVYEGGTSYREWEFIWDPTKEMVGVGQPVAVPGAPGTSKPAAVPPQPPQ